MNKEVFSKPFVVKLKQYDTTIKIKKKRSDIDASELAEMLASLVQASGFGINTVLDYLEEYRVDDELLK